jgi:transcription elongation factor GreA
MDRIPMTDEGYKRKMAELENMESEEMPAILKRLGEARAEGDLRENAEYHGARESQGMLQAKINKLRGELSSAIIVDMSKLPKGEVVFGCTVTVKDLDDDDEEDFTLVGLGDEDYNAGKIQVTSPMAKGLLGKKVGETAEIQAPKGTIRFEILNIRFDG